MLNELMCLSAIIWGEARGEAPIGQVAAAYTAINRKKDPRYPDNICKIMQQPNQYEFLSKVGMPTEKQFGQFIPLAKAILEGRVDDPTRGAKWFHTKNIKPIWSKDKTVKIALGNHIFY